MVAANTSSASVLSDLSALDVLALTAATMPAEQKPIRLRRWPN